MSEKAGIIVHGSPHEEEKYNEEEESFTDEKYYSEEESSISYSYDENYDDDLVNPNSQKIVYSEKQLEAMKKEHEIQVEELKIIDEDLAEQADSSEYVSISDDSGDLRQSSHRNFRQHRRSRSESGSNKAASKKILKEKRREAREERRKARHERKNDDIMTISESSKSKHENNEEKSILQANPHEYDDLRRESRNDDSFLASCGDRYDEKDNDYKDKQQLKFEIRKAKRIARAKRRRERLERKGERMQEKIEKRNAKIESKRHRHSKHFD